MSHSDNTRSRLTNTKLHKQQDNTLSPPVRRLKHLTKYNKQPNRKMRRLIHNHLNNQATAILSTSPHSFTLIRRRALPQLQIILTIPTLTTSYHDRRHQTKSLTPYQYHTTYNTATLITTSPKRTRHQTLITNNHTTTRSKALNRIQNTNITKNILTNLRHTRPRRVRPPHRQ